MQRWSSPASNPASASQTRQQQSEISLIRSDDFEEEPYRRPNRQEEDVVDEERRRSSLSNEAPLPGASSGTSMETMPLARSRSGSSTKSAYVASPHVWPPLHASAVSGSKASSDYEDDEDPTLLPLVPQSAPPAPAAVAAAAATTTATPATSLLTSATAAEGGAPAKKSIKSILRKLLFVKKTIKALQSQSRSYQNWRVFVFLVCIYLMVEVPLRSCFQAYPDDAALSIDALLDFVLWIDIGLHFSKHLQFDDQGSAVDDVKQRISLYRKSGMFVVDVLASIPFDLLAAFPGISYHPVMRINRLLRVFRMNEFFSIIEKRTGFNPSAVRIYLFTFFLLLCTHWTACLFFLVVYAQGSNASLSFQYDPMLMQRSLYGQYIRSAVWAVVSLTGYQNSNPFTDWEFFFYICVSLFGAMAYVAIIGTVASLLSNLDSSKQYFREKMDTINELMKFRQLPAEMQAKITDYYVYLWGSRKGLDEGQITADLPQYLQMEIAMFLNKDIITKVPMFQLNDNAHFISAVVTKMRPRVALPGALIVRRGEVGKEMFFIARGSVEVVSEDGTVVYATLHEGSHFGEVALLFSGKRTASVRAKTYCDLFILTKEDFHQVLSEFPEESQAVQQEAERRYAAMVKK